MMYKVITTFKKLMLTFLLKQNFASQIKMSHMSYLDLIFTEMTSISLASEHPMELLCVQIVSSSLGQTDTYYIFLHVHVQVHIDNVNIFFLFLLTSSSSKQFD